MKTKQRLMPGFELYPHPYRSFDSETVQKLRTQAAFAQSASQSGNHSASSMFVPVIAGFVGFAGMYKYMVWF